MTLNDLTIGSRAASSLSNAESIRAGPGNLYRAISGVSA
jgi:hypothetical protein